MIYKDFDSLFERFSILTIDAHLSDEAALRILKKVTTEELYNQLINKLREINLRGCK